MLEPCQKDIYENGELVFMTTTIRAVDVDSWVKKIAADCGQPIDWHYGGGRACILALGDLEKVRASLKKFRAEHDALYTVESRVYMGKDYDPSCYLQSKWEHYGLD